MGPQICNPEKIKGRSKNVYIFKTQNKFCKFVDPSLIPFQMEMYITKWKAFTMNGLLEVFILNFEILSKCCFRSTICIRNKCAE